MCSLNPILLAIFLIAGCGPAPKDTSFTSTTGGAESVQQGIQATEIYLPNISGGETQAAESTAGEQEWHRYHHAYWGMTFNYPAGWQVDMPDLEARVEVSEDAASDDVTYMTDMQLATTYGYLVTLKPAERSDSASDISIGLESVVLAPEMSLREWIKIRIQEGLWFHGYDWEGYEPKLTPFPHEDRPNVDEIWMELSEEGSHQALATIYMSIGKLVYAVRFRPDDPALQEIAEKFVSSLEFDLAKQQELAALPYYSTDITVYLQEMLNYNPTPVPSDEESSEIPDSPDVSFTPTAVQ